MLNFYNTDKVFANIKTFDTFCVNIHLQIKTIRYSEASINAALILECFGTLVRKKLRGRDSRFIRDSIYPL